MFLKVQITDYTAHTSADADGFGVRARVRWWIMQIVDFYGNQW